MWLNDRPTTPGFYWCHQRGKTRIVHIWRYKNGTELFTNEDSGASIKDTLYDGTQWMAVVIPPNPQDQNESAQPAPNFADAYQGAMEEVAIWKKRALEAEDLNRKFIAEINGPMHMGEPAQNVPNAVAYLDLGTGGYMDIGTDLTDEALASLPEGRHMLGIVGTYGVDGYAPAQPAPSDEYVGWYCAHCQRGVDASEVTYHEQHQVCGRVITEDKPPKPAPSVSDIWPIHADPFTYVIQHLNSNPYPLTKDETITFIKELRALYNAATEAKP